MLRVLLSPGGVKTVIRLSLGLVAVLVAGMPLWEHLGAGDAVRAAFSPYCHQRMDRSLAVAGEILPVCARCTGLWLGAFAASIVLPAVRPARELVSPSILAAAALPMAIDLGLEHLVGTGPHAMARLLTGLTLGAAVIALLLPALVRAGEEVLDRCGTRNSISRA